MVKLLVFSQVVHTKQGNELRQGAITIAQLTENANCTSCLYWTRNIKELFSQKTYLVYGEPFYVIQRGKEGREEFMKHLEQQLESLTAQLYERYSKMMVKGHPIFYGTAPLFVV